MQIKILSVFVFLLLAVSAQAEERVGVLPIKSDLASIKLAEEVIMGVKSTPSFSAVDSAEMQSHLSEVQKELGIDCSTMNTECGAAVCSFAAIPLSLLVDFISETNTIKLTLIDARKGTLMREASAPMPNDVEVRRKNIVALTRGLLLNERPKGTLVLRYIKENALDLLSQKEAQLSINGVARDVSAQKHEVAAGKVSLLLVAGERTLKKEASVLAGETSTLELDVSALFEQEEIGEQKVIAEEKGFPLLTVSGASLMGLGLVSGVALLGGGYVLIPTREDRPDFDNPDDFNARGDLGEALMWASIGSGVIFLLGAGVSVAGFVSE